MSVQFLETETIDYADFPLPIDLQNDGREHQASDDLTACFALTVDSLD